MRTAHCTLHRCTLHAARCTLHAARCTLHAAGGEAFELYGAVCHYGSVSGGHYTSFAKQAMSGQWHHFNDAQVAEGSVVHTALQATVTTV